MSYNKTAALLIKNKIAQQKKLNTINTKTQYKKDKQKSGLDRFFVVEYIKMECVKVLFKFAAQEVAKSVKPVCTFLVLVCRYSIRGLVDYFGSV